VDQGIRVPVLHLHGANDRVVLERTARRSGDWAANGYHYEVLPHIGHFIQQEAPEQVTALLVGFLRLRHP
jgi:pimeloyl-ACP methyl ester carboxylesterase